MNMAASVLRVLGASLLVALWTSAQLAAAAEPRPLSRAWVPETDVPTPTSADCYLSHFTQRLDHFSTTDPRTFSQRYFWNDTFFQPGGPILYYTGNEADVTLYVNATGLMWQHARELGALLVFGEHRYYGETLPFGAKPTVPELEWLSVEQSLEDHVALVSHIKKTVAGADRSKVVAIGGSYGGMQSAWARMRYPHVFDGAIAGSAPILAFDGVAKADAKKAGPSSYWKIVTDDASAAFGSAPACSENVRKTWLAMDRMFASGVTGRRQLQRHLSLCKPIASLADLVLLKNFLIMAWDTMAMGNFPFPSSCLASGRRAACVSVPESLLLSLDLLQ